MPWLLQDTTDSSVGASQHRSGLEKETAEKKARQTDEMGSSIVVAPALKVHGAKKVSSTAITDFEEEAHEENLEEESEAVTAPTGVLSFFGSRAL